MAAAVLPVHHASLFDSRNAGSDSSENDEDLYVGTSSGASHRNLAGARPLTVQSLIENKVHFVPQEHTHAFESIPYHPINLATKVRTRVRCTCARTPL